MSCHWSLIGDLTHWPYLQLILAPSLLKILRHNEFPGSELLPLHFMWCKTFFQCIRNFELNGQTMMCLSSVPHTKSKWLVPHEPNDLVLQIIKHIWYILAQDNVCSENFGSTVAFLANICICKLRIFSPPHNCGVHIFHQEISSMEVIMFPDDQIEESI